MKDKIKNEIKNKIYDAEINIQTNNNKYFNIIIISNEFDKKPIVDRQKMIYDILEKYIIDKSINAISFKTYSKNEWLNH